MPPDFSHAHVAFDFLANEFVELATAFSRRDSKLGEEFLKVSQDRLSTQFEGLRSKFAEAGLASEFSELLHRAQTTINDVMATARDSQGQKSQ